MSGIDSDLWGTDQMYGCFFMAQRRTDVSGSVVQFFRVPDSRPEAT
ncbi:MAG: hypothetical protein Q4C47_05715 [Planctomycetia bacterium]|nr:hypothetical protein [Planctomycetia bacterium]